ncbi:MAG: hypothetical protein JWP77_2380 [Polaromonas sp.]|jgi:hypothetical protein|nr:hypothetical protein [Polaromonas sp.]
MPDKLAPLIDTPPGRYRHYKGMLYEVVGTVRHSETLEPMTLYRALYGEHGLWVRPAAMFNEDVVVGGVRQPRFRREPEGQVLHNADPTRAQPNPSHQLISPVHG